MSAGTDAEKRLAAHAAAELVADGMRVGLGTGSTVAHLLPALAARGLEIRCVATSPRTEAAAREAGLVVEGFDGRGAPAELDIAIDGADQVAPDGWLVKGGGGAHAREKIVAAAAEQFVVIVDSSKPVEALRPPVPLELLEFGLAATLREIGLVELRPGAERTPDGNLLADYAGPIRDPVLLGVQFSATPGVVEHGLFPPGLVSEVLIGRGDEVERRSV